jgi:hypothetical protein
MSTLQIRAGRDEEVLARDLASAHRRLLSSARTGDPTHV